MPDCQIDDVKLHYAIQGTGEPLFLSYCLGGNLGMWGHEIDALARRHTVILWDPRGHGGTTSPPSAADYGVNRSAQDLACLMDSLGIQRAIVGGVSMGGGSAACFAGRYPERTRAVLIMDSNTAAGLPVPDAVVDARTQTIELCKAGDMTAVAEYFLATSPAYRLFAGNTPENQQRLKTMICNVNATGFANTLSSMLVAETQTSDLENISAPTLVLAGSEDPAMKAIELTAATISHSQFVHIPDAGHLSNIDQPTLFAQKVIHFTDSLD